MRNLAVDFIKGVSIVGVILAHSNFSNRFDVNTIELITVLQDYFSWCVVGFFFASGLLSKTPELKDARQYLIANIKRLIIPAIVFSVSYRVVNLLLSALGLLETNYLPNSPLELLEFIILPIGPQFYFLQVFPLQY